MLFESLESRQHPTSIIQFQLWDTALDKKIMNLPSSGSVAIDLSTTGSKLAVVAVADFSTSSVKFGGSWNHVEDTAVYASNGNNASDLYADPRFSSAGKLSLSVTPYSRDNQNGTRGTTRSLTINLVKAQTPQPTPDESPASAPTPAPAPTGTVVDVSTVSQLQSAVANLQSGGTIMIAPGTYNLTSTLDLPQNRSNLAIRGATGNRDEVILRGAGIWAGNVNGLTIADLTIDGDFKAVHGISLNAGTERPLIHNVHLLDINDQMIKANPDGALGGVDGGIVEYCLMEYPSGWAPDYYVAGIDIHTGDDWLIQHNTFKGFRQQSGATTGTHPALLVWNDSRNTRVLSNTFTNNDWDIALGLEAASRNNPSVPDQQGGLIDGNVISRDAATHGDSAIYVSGPNTKVYRNSYDDASDFYPNAVEYRFAITTNTDIRDNTLDGLIKARDGATGTVANNVIT